MSDLLAARDIALVRAPNPSPLTLTGTNTWVLGRHPAWVIDPWAKRCDFCATTHLNHMVAREALPSMMGISHGWQFLRSRVGRPAQRSLE